MRFKTFRSLVIVGAVGAGAAGLYGLSRLGGGPEELPPPVERPVRRAAVERPPSTAPVEPAGAAADASPDALRPMDREILARAGKGISGDKAKDAIRGRAWKVNLYQDAGHSRVNRLKVDLDRDEKWDEKWTFTSDGGTDGVKRQVAPNDDESYTEEYRLDGERWRRK